MYKIRREDRFNLTLFYLSIYIYSNGVCLDTPRQKIYSYVLTCIDIFSKKAWAIPIKKKTSVTSETMKAFNKIFEFKRIPNAIFLDKGNEFKGECEKLFKKHKIKIITSTTKLKASVVERFNRTLKEIIFRIFTHNKNTKYSDILPDILDSYNNSYHRSIKTTLNSVNEKR